MQILVSTQTAGILGSGGFSLYLDLTRTILKPLMWLKKHPSQPRRPRYHPLVRAVRLRLQQPRPMKVTGTNTAPGSGATAAATGGSTLFDTEVTSTRLRIRVTTKGSMKLTSGRNSSGIHKNDSARTVTCGRCQVPMQLSTTTVDIMAIVNSRLISQCRNVNGIVPASIRLTGHTNEKRTIGVTSWSELRFANGSFLF